MKIKHGQNTSISATSTKKEPSTSAYLVSTISKKNFAPSNAVKKKSSWDEEDESFDSGPGAIDSWQKNKISSIEQQRLSELLTPKLDLPNYFSITTASKVPLLIIDQFGKDWKDLLCYNYELKTVMHLKREDLLPRELVDAAIIFLQALKR